MAEQFPWIVCPEIMGDRSKREAERAELVRKFEEMKNAQPRQLFRCRSCRECEREVFAPSEMGGFIFCDECISAAQIISERKAGRSA